MRSRNEPGLIASGIYWIKFSIRIEIELPPCAEGKTTGSGHNPPRAGAVKSERYVANFIFLGGL
jgi:hypothetical protein